MALWGKIGSVTLTGTGASTLDSAVITGTGTAFLAEVSVGSVIDIANNLYTVVTVVSDVTLNVVPVAASTLTGQVVVLMLRPTFVSQEDSLDINLTTTAEAQADQARDLGIKTPGWNKIVTYTDAQGATRSKVENLVVFKS